jgi:hypothetical protein
MRISAIKFVLPLIVITGLLRAQDALEESKSPLQNPVNLNTSKSMLDISSKSNLIKSLDAEAPAKLHIIPLQNEMDIVFPKKKIEENKLDLVSSFRSNIRFGGFWDKYAIINFSPSIFVQPTDFLSVYANHNTSMFIPIKEIKDEFKNLCIKGAAVLAIDNLFKVIGGSNKTLPLIANFTIKNIVLSILQSAMSKGNDCFEQRSYYYAVSIRF